MRVQAFIPDWDSPTCNSYEVYSRLSPYCSTEILSSYGTPFREQWNEALSLFTDDIMIWAMADCRPENWDCAYPAMLKLMNRGDIGIWAPHLNKPSQLTRKSVEIESGIFDVQFTNMVCIAISKTLLDQMPVIEMHPNGWMYDYLMTAVARRNGMKNIVDTRFEVLHKYGSIYDTTAAEQEMKRWHERLPEPWKQDINKLREEAR